MAIAPVRDISVVISTRNRAPLLNDMLAALQEQQLQNTTWEVVVINNGSTDSTQSVLEQNWPGLELVGLFEPIAGKSRALNRALEITRGALVVFTDDDVKLSPSWVLGYLWLRRL